MTLLVTGATGFVMSVLGRHWLESDPAARLVVLDASPLDAAAEHYFSPVRKRLAVITADVTQSAAWPRTAAMSHLTDPTEPIHRMITVPGRCPTRSS